MDDREHDAGPSFETVAWSAEPAQGGSGSADIIDLTARADRSARKGIRNLAQVKALVLHQMACCHQRRNPLQSYLRLKAHYAILPDGRILQMHPDSAMLWASNGFNHGSVAVEFAGNFPDTQGRWWQGHRYGRNRVTPAQIEAGRRLVRHLVAKIGLRTVLAHRQSSATRENDPGPDLWYHVGQWAVDTLGLRDGGPGFKVGDGHAIPELWRRWGRMAPAATVAGTPGLATAREFEAAPQQPASAAAEARVVAALIRLGVRDENTLTDRVFSLRHPSRDGRPILRTESALGAEWLDIRSRTVRPALRSAGFAPSGTPAPALAAYRALLPLLQRHRGEVPLPFLLGWIAVESGGRIGTTTHLDERGFFQIHPDESRALGLDHARLGVDPGYSIAQGIALARFQAATAARRYGYAAGSALSWPLSKLLHWLPLGVQVIMDMMRRQGGRPQTWEQLRSFVATHREAIQKEIKRRDRHGRSWDPARGIANVDKVLTRGQQIARALGV